MIQLKPIDDLFQKPNVHKESRRRCWLGHILCAIYALHVAFLNYHGHHWCICNIRYISCWQISE